MNKKLMAVAVAGALAAPGLAFAQAAQVQLYGVIDIRFDSMKYSTDAAGVNTGMTKQHVHTTAPRWGIRGTEDLGGGLSAFFQLEAGSNPDGRAATTGGATGSLGGRDSFMGLRSGWGEFAIGGFTTAYRDPETIWNAVPTFGHGGIIMANGDTTGTNPSPNCLESLPPTGSVGTTLTTAVVAAGANGAGTVCQGGGVEGNTTSFHRRAGNYMQYTSPVFSGFRFRIGTALSEYAEAPSATTAGANRNKPTLWSYTLTWSGGPFSLGAGYEQHKGFRATNVAATNRDAKDDAFQLGGKWNFGPGELGLGWERLKYGNAAVVAADNSFRQDNWVLNGNYRITPAGTIAAGYSRTSGQKNCGVGVVAICGSPTSANVFSLSYDHAMSKRTALYAAYGRINNGTSTAYYYIVGPASNNAGGDTGGLAAGTDVTTYAVGIKHSF